MFHPRRARRIYPSASNREFNPKKPDKRPFIMTTIPPTVKIRLSVLLLAACTAAFTWESFIHSGYRHVTGEVVKVEHVFAGKGGDSKAFTVRYAIRDENYYFVSRRGILDSLGSLRNLRQGDRVPIAVRPAPPFKAVFDTLSGRYPITLCFVALTVVFLTVMVIPATTGARSSPRS
jgi:hypothetical protein